MENERALLLSGTVAGLLITFSSFGSWNNSGPASSVSGFELSGMFSSGVFETWAPRWVGGVLLIVPLAGAAFLIGVGLNSKSGRVLMGISLALALVFDLLASAALRWAPVTSPGAGAALLHLGLLLGVGTLVWGICLRTRTV